MAKAVSEGLSKVRPVFRWCGGKSRMIGRIIPGLPDKMGTYFEPFLGGGAVFFELCRRKAFKKAVLADANPDLMACYKAIQTDVEAILDILLRPEFTYGKSQYLEMRSQNPADMSAPEAAARFIYLNKTCFNGLYRVNRKGQFNVPFGQLDDPVIRDVEALRAVNRSFKNVTLLRCDYALALKGVKRGDGVYIDPPYLPISKTSSFTGYTSEGFNLADHVKLAHIFGELCDKGASVILSNSNSDVVRHLYAKYNITDVTGSRSVGGPAAYRKPVTEIIVTGKLNVLNGQDVRPSSDCSVEPVQHH